MSLRFDMARIYETAAVMTARGVEPLDALETHVLAAWRIACDCPGGYGGAHQLVAMTGLSLRAVKQRLLALEHKQILVADAPAADRKGGRGRVAGYRLSLANGVLMKGIGLLSGTNPAPVDEAANGGSDDHETVHGMHGFQPGNHARGAQNGAHSARFVGNHAHSARFSDPQEIRKKLNTGERSPGGLQRGKYANRKPTRASLAFDAVERACKRL